MLLEAYLHPTWAHFPPKLVPSWFQESPSWPQVGAKLAPRGTQEPLEKDHKTGPKKQANKKLSKSTQNHPRKLRNPSWGPLRGFNTRGNTAIEASETFPSGLEARGRRYIYIYICIANACGESPPPFDFWHKNSIKNPLRTYQKIIKLNPKLVWESILGVFPKETCWPQPSAGLLWPRYPR